MALNQVHQSQFGLWIIINTPTWVFQVAHSKPLLTLSPNLSYTLPHQFAA